MDRPGPRAAALGLVLAGAAVVGAFATTGTPLRALRWLSPEADPVQVLGSAPTECLSPAPDAETAYRIEVGRAAFRSPLLLGGQAARAGLACESCHREGRSNPDFQFPGVSGRPGTADVTSSLFSSRRGDGIDNPKPIPDLSGPPAALKVSRAPEGRALEGFVHGLVVDEFDGAEPPPAVLDGLATYVRALSPAACPAQGRRPLRAADLIEDARRAARAGLAAQARGDTATAVVMVQAARSRLGLVFERYDGPDLAKPRADLLAADRGLADVLVRLRDRDPAAPVRLRAWLDRSDAWSRGLLAAEPRSLFDPRRLAALSRG
ncbi:hypothetical protein [Caulobacter sp. UNC279MFTsu5.1]|uniref:hypothetical protein n=1 Tax=Caulobacter sp. UNC279MFTsu5.1 TaxID=1502775 RepID=UPI0008ECA22B|nr:hypothetical protein [Caulobacter sp. UNC279MFTsu5.1]SFK07368.1 hypothetical protein SAMN02799626_03337 [Caulobacter sp. UNC279MFTsu5.1]